MLILRLVPLFPFWLVNIVPAMLRVPLHVFALTTAIGIVPGSFVFVGLGNGLGHILEAGELPGLATFLAPEVLDAAGSPGRAVGLANRLQTLARRAGDG